jgi:hypothetical protein
MTDPYLEKERKRLAHAREHADCIILTDGLTPDQVAARALTCLEEMGIRL